MPKILDLAMQMAAQRSLRLIAGNHEQMFLASFDDRLALMELLQHGARERLLRHCLDRAVYAR